MINTIGHEPQYLHTYEDQSLYWSTFDLGLASAILSVSSSELIDLDRTNVHKVRFIFLKKGDGEIEKIAKDYWNNNLQVDGLTFFNNTKKIKNRLYSSI